MDRMKHAGKAGLKLRGTSEVQVRAERYSSRHHQGRIHRNIADRMTVVRLKIPYLNLEGFLCRPNSEIRDSCEILRVETPIREDSNIGTTGERHWWQSTPARAGAEAAVKADGEERSAANSVGLCDARSTVPGSIGSSGLSCCAV
ncbi:hypothetical protein FB451DRAFT_1171563 [Mycena latifolia]|nr:hypothetical protein FB451DRAFT_1171563 [Mycena latifolia]